MDRAGKSPIDFKKFFEEFFPAVYALMRKYTQEDEVAWDLAQDAFLKLWDKWDEFAGEENAKAFVYTVAKNLFVNYRNREKLKAEVKIRATAAGRTRIIRTLITNWRISADCCSRAGTMRRND